MTTYTLNTELNGIEIRFDEKPGEETRGALKAAGYRWHKARRLWYAKQTPERLELAERITAGRMETGSIVRAEGTAKEKAAAWTAERLSAIRAGYTFDTTGEGIYSGWTGCNALEPLYGQELKKAILAELKKHGIKATAREDSGCYHTSFTFTVTVPEAMQDTAEAYALRLAKGEERCPAWVYASNGKNIHCDDMPYEYEARLAIFREHAAHAYADECHPVEAFEETIKTIVRSFNSNHSNGMIDYFDRGFYDSYKWKAA